MESILYAVFLLGAVFCAYRAIVAKRILSATIYLACISALVSAIVYLMGAVQVAVMELSVGAGLVTVLLVYAVSVVGDDALDPASVIPEPLAFGLVGAVALILGIQPASVDIGKRSARGFCGLWLRLCRGLVQPSDTEIPARFRPNHHIHTVSPILIPHPYYKLSQKHSCSRHCERSEAISEEIPCENSVRDCFVGKNILLAMTEKYFETSSVMAGYKGDSHLRDRGFLDMV